MNTPKLHGIIGHPLGHTMSPALHNWAFKTLDIPAQYKAFPVLPQDLAAFMQTVRETPIEGLSVTIPHKETVGAYLDGISQRAQSVGAVNTVYRDGGKLLGENTDVTGFMAPLKALDTLPATAMVLGAGGAARAVITGLKELGVDGVLISNRTYKRAMELGNEFTISAIPWDERAIFEAELIINTTPMGMQGELETASPWPQTVRLASHQIVYDIVYNPLETALLAQAKARGCATIDGLHMFVHQGAEQFRLWTGQTFDTTEARALLIQELGL